jgi:hypothetical protein
MYYFIVNSVPVPYFLIQFGEAIYYLVAGLTDKSLGYYSAIVGYRTFLF